MTTKLIGMSTGVCAACGHTSQLEVVESRRRRGVTDLLDRTFHESVLRTAHCRGCLTTYPIRISDDTARKAGRRRTRYTGRDWDYSQVA
ncbi:MAG: hypothetical protein JWO12_3474 [Frankiales bacterium]|nr:hypothetical protein [Frankiales bacterium]